MTVRTEFAAKLRTDWASIPALSKLTIKVTERALDDVKTPTLLIRQKTVGRAPEAPMSHRKVGMLLTFISPAGDLDVAADDLDTWLDAALDYLDKTFEHDDAESVGYNNRLAYDLPVTVLASKE